MGAIKQLLVEINKITGSPRGRNGGKGHYYLQHQDGRSILRRRGFDADILGRGYLSESDLYQALREYAQALGGRKRARLVRLPRDVAPEALEAAAMWATMANPRKLADLREWIASGTAHPGMAADLAARSADPSRIAFQHQGRYSWIIYGGRARLAARSTILKRL